VSLRRFILSFPVVVLAISCSPPGAGESSGHEAASGGQDAVPPAADLAQVAQESIMSALPLSPTQLAELESTLRRVHSLSTQMQGASHQGEARLVQRELSHFLDGLDRPLPFRKNLENIVEILSESSGDELSESEKSGLRTEVQDVLSELGLETSGSGDDGFPAFGPARHLGTLDRRARSRDEHAS